MRRKNKKQENVIINTDFASLYPSTMTDFTKDRKIIAELKRIERKRKLEQLNNKKDE